MTVYTVGFFGHRRLYNSIRIEERLEELVRELLQTKQYVEFLVGKDGDFDILVASVIRRCKRLYRDDNSSLVLALPYMRADLRDNEDAYREYFDEIEVFSGTHYKSAFQERNRAMCDRADLVVFAVNRAEGGAYSTMKYAAVKGVNTINLYDILEENDK